MASYLFHNAVVLLAKRTLSRLEAAMERKRRLATYTFPGFAPLGPLLVGPVNPVVHRRVEDQVFALVRASNEMLGGGGPIQMPAGALLNDGAGKYAVMGSIGLELPAMIEYLRPGQGWISAIIRRGSVDPNYSKAIVPTTHFALRFGELALARAGNNEGKRRKIEAFVMGMMCSIAAEFVSNPILRGMSAASSFRDWDRFSPAPALAAADGIIARDLLGSPTREVWESWWPSDTDVPQELFDGFDAALREVYPLASPPIGFIDFAANFEPGRRPDARDLKNAYSLFRHGNITVARNWGVVDWWVYLLSITLPPALGALIATPLPRAKDLFLEDSELERELDSRAASEVLTTGYLTGIFTPFGTTMALHSLIPGDWDPYFDSIALFVIRLMGLAVFIGFVAGDVSPIGRWILFAALLGTDLYALIRGFVDLARGRRGPALLYFVQALPILSMGLVGLIALVLRAGRYQFGSLGWGLTLLIAAVIYVFGLGFLAAWLLSRTGGLTVFLRERREGVPLLESVPAAGGTVPRSNAHLFDDATLWKELRDQGQPLATHRYPPGRRAILDLKWTGDGELTLNARRSTLIFQRVGGAQTTVTMPNQSVTAFELKALLESRVPGLEANLIDDEPAQVRFPAPDMFSDPGDEEVTFALHDGRVNEFLPVGKTDDTMFRLRHAPRSKQTTPFGVRGQSGSPLDSYKLVPEKTLHDLDASAFGMAADLASLLCVGAARHLRTGLQGQDTATPPAAVPLTPAFRVFRQWNLDERRVNEWRMVVHGGAASERYQPVGSPAGTLADEGVRPQAPASPIATGETLANAMGWVPMWRAWTRMAADPLSDATAASAERHTPVVNSAAGRTPPTNQELTDAMRFLLDLA
jgi:hypothetical protein